MGVAVPAMLIVAVSCFAVSDANKANVDSTIEKARALCITAEQLLAQGRCGAASQSDPGWNAMLMNSTGCATSFTMA